MNIRTATAQDLPQILELWRLQFELHHELDKECYLPYTTELEQKVTAYLTEGVAKSDPVLFVAVEMEKVVGFASCREETETYLDTPITSFGFIYELFVSPEARHAGIGKQILEHVERYFAEKGFQYVKLYSSVFNKPALDFYERTGYTAHQQVFLKKIS